MTTQLHHSHRPESDGEEAARVSAMRERRAAERSEGLARLLLKRPDLAGVHLPADLAAEAVRWSA